MPLFLDLDGTLTDSRVGILASIRYALDAIGVASPPDEVLLRLIGPPTRDAFRTLLGPEDDALVERAVSLYRERYSTVGIFENSVYPGVREALQDLRTAGFRLWVVTSKPQLYADRIIDHFRLRGDFQRVYGPELGGERADKGDLIAYVLQTEGLQASDAWMIGDRSHDVAGAKKNGVHSAGVLWGYGSGEELLAAGAEVLFASTRDLVRHFSCPGSTAKDPSTK
jgi:phosphoglycolate phosphatase